MPTRPSTHSKSKTPAKPLPAKSSAKDSKHDKHEKPTAKAAPAKPVAKEPVKEKASAKHDKHADHAPAAKAGAGTRLDKATTGREEPMTMPKIAAAAPVSVEEPLRPSMIQTTMSKTQLARFRKLLEDKRDDIIKKAKQTLDEDMALDANDLPDEMDLASSEYLQSFTFRLRGREKSFLDKIEKALDRILNNTFGVCEECGEEISVKRLEARPETTLCIRCKEDQERAEKDYG
ncbi:MAG: hypothetical protein NVS3B10_25490 [Polyangiales bacterium]